MNLEEIKQTARNKMKGYCRVCKNCNGIACAGEVPGMGGIGTGSSFTANIEALANVKLNLRTLHDAKTPDVSTNILGIDLSMPILSAPITGSDYNMGGAIPEAEYISMVMSGSKIEMAKQAEEINAPAVGMDIDGAGLVTMALMGQPVGPKNLQEIKEIMSAVDLPFILKGIMTVDEAKLASEAGAAAIVVSNHGGRILDSTPGVAQVLPAIAAKLKGKITILADGGVRSGVDVLKYLALGADAVLVGRPVIIGAFGGGGEGVRLVLETMANELKQAMILTGCKDIKSINSSVIY